MLQGALTGYIDVAQVVLYVFRIFFAGLIFYLHRESKREGYPLVSDRSVRSGGRVRVTGFPSLPTNPKIFYRPHQAPINPGRVDTRELRMRPLGPWLGAPNVPTGNPMADGIGPGAYAQREDVPELTSDGQPMIVPLRIAAALVDEEDFDPRGMRVIGADNLVAGTVSDLWVDRAEPQIRYLEVELAGAAAGPVLLPIYFARIHGRRGQVHVKSILASQFAGVPLLKSGDQVTKLEEDKIMAYYAGGTLYATAARAEPLL